MDSLVVISVSAGGNVLPLAPASASAGASALAPGSPSPSGRGGRHVDGGTAASVSDRLLISPILAGSSRATRIYSCSASAPVPLVVAAHGGRARRRATAIVSQERCRAACQSQTTTRGATNHLAARAVFSSSLRYSRFLSAAEAVGRGAASCRRIIGDVDQLSGSNSSTFGACIAAVDRKPDKVVSGVRIRRRVGRERGRSATMASVAVGAEAETISVPGDKPILFDVPVSNNGGRVRLVLYIKELEDEVMIKPPAAIGGLKSEAYLALNPLGKMPLLVFPDGTSIFESEVISEYFLDKYIDKGPSFIPTLIELRITSNLAKRILDMYMMGPMAAMYRAMDVESRAKGIGELNKYLDVLEDIITSTPYVAGPEISSGDTALFPNFVFMNYMLPQFFGWNSIFTRRPKLQSWWETMSALPAGARVREEMETALNAWKESGRWDNIRVTEHIKDSNYQWKF